MFLLSAIKIKGKNSLFRKLTFKAQNFVGPFWGKKEPVSSTTGPIT